MTTATGYRTWADAHPEVAANSAREPISWPCEKIKTDLGWCHQPSIVRDVKGELYAEGGDGKIFHSTDGGRSWARLCQSPTLFEVPEGMKHIVTGQGGVNPSPPGPSGDDGAESNVLSVRYRNIYIEKSYKSAGEKLTAFLTQHLGLVRATMGLIEGWPGLDDGDRAHALEALRQLVESERRDGA